MNLLSAYRLPLLLGLAHGVSDCVAGFLIGNVSGAVTLQDKLGIVLMYNVIAFGGQLPIGMFLRTASALRIAMTLGMLFTASAIITGPTVPWAAMLLAGLGSALVHVAGGAACLSALPGKASSPGLFAGPGVIGLALGGAMAIWSVPATFALIALAILLVAAIALHRFPNPSPDSDDPHDFEWHDLIMILLLLAIGMRSAVWNVFTALNQGDTMLLLAMAGAACAGKLSGGFIADRIGWRNYAVGALTGAAALLSFGGAHPYMLVAGIGLLQSATPVAVAVMHRAMPRHAGAAAGLSLGLAIALGGMPHLMGLRPEAPPEWLWGLIALGSAGLYWLAIKKLPAKSPGKRLGSTAG